MKYLEYLWYIVRHKWFVLVAGLRVKAPLWNLIVHDLSKLMPDEFFAYADFFYDEPLQAKEREQVFMLWGLSESAPFGYYTKDRFNLAWLLHQRRNHHHWQYWFLMNDDGLDFPLPMPDGLAREMVADWMGAGRTITGDWGGTRGWYDGNREKIRIHPETRFLVELLIDMEW